MIKVLHLSFYIINRKLLIIRSHLLIYLKGIERELVSNTVDGPSAPIEEPIPTLSWPPEAFDNTSGEEDSLLSIGAASISMMNKSGKSVPKIILLLSICSFLLFIIFIAKYLFHITN